VALVAKLSFGGEAINLRQTEFRVTTSSVLNNQSQYRGENVLDNNLETAWVEGVPGPGIGEWIQIQFVHPYNVTHVGIVPGYAKHDPYSNRFYENNRVGSATLYINENIRKQIEFYDLHVMQYFVLPNIPLETFKLRVDTICPGSRWDDTCISEIRFLVRETESDKTLQILDNVVPFENEAHTFKVLKFNKEAGSDLLKWLEARDIVEQVYQMDINRLHQHKKELLEMFTIRDSRVHRNVLEGLTKAAITFDDKEIVRFLLYSSIPEGSQPEEWKRERRRWLALGKIAYAIPVTFSEVLSEQPAVYTTFTVQSESLDVEYLNAQLESHLSELERVGASEEVKEMIKRRGIGHNRWASVGGNIYFFELRTRSWILIITGSLRC